MIPSKTNSEEAVKLHLKDGAKPGDWQEAFAGLMP